MKDRRQSPLRQLPNRPGTLNQLKRLGNAIRDDDAQAGGNVHYDELFGWHSDLVVAAIKDLARAPLKRALSNPDTLTITGRAKTRVSESHDPNVEIVSLVSDSIESIQRTHSRYFANA